MLLSLLKFVLRTRFSRPFLIFILLMIVYSITISQAVPPSGVSTVLSYYIVGIVAFFLSMSLATGGVMVMKSDRDYLFTLPLSSRDLSLSIFFSQFIAYGVTVLLLFAYLAQSFTKYLLIVDLVALALTFTSLGALAPSIRTRRRILLSVALAVWTLLAFAKVPFTPGSAFSENVYYGTATLLALAALTVTLAFRRLPRIELDMVKSMVRTSSSEVKSPNSYAGRSPIGAIYSMNLSNMSLAGRFNMAGTARYVSKRVKSQWVLGVASAGSVAYFAFVLLTYNASLSGADSLPAQIIVTVVLAFLAFAFSQSAITYERVWLSLTSLPPASYFRNLIAAKVLSMMLILGPFAVVDAVLLAMGYAGAAGSLLVVAVVIPAFFVLEVCFTAYTAPIQVKGDDMMMPAQFSLRQMASAVPLIAIMGLAAASAALPMVAAVGGVVMWAISALLILSGGFWSSVLTRLTESGFV